MITIVIKSFVSCVMLTRDRLVGWVRVDWWKNLILPFKKKLPLLWTIQKNNNIRVILYATMIYTAMIPPGCITKLSVVLFFKLRQTFTSTKTIFSKKISKISNNSLWNLSSIFQFFLILCFVTIITDVNF